MEEYDCRGKLSSLTLESVRPDPALPEEEEQRLFVAKLFYDNSGLLFRKQEARKTVFFHYGDDGLLEREVEVREKERISRERRFVYSAGRLLQEISENDKTTYHYDSRDRLAYSTNWVGEIEESVCSYGYDDGGRIILQEIRTKDDHLLRSVRLKRNIRGLIEEELLVNQDNMVLENNRYTYPVFHGENWLKRECWSREEGKEPVLKEVLYRSISLAPEAADAVTPPPQQSGSDEKPEASSEAQEKAPAVETTEQREDAPQKEESLMQGELLFRNGRYRGAYDRENRPQGNGEFWGKDGSRYSGGFLDGMMHGKGNLLHKNGSSYTGTFSEGLPEGDGECLWPDGSRYRGEFVKGEMHGIGVFTWADGTRFTGLFEHNRSTDQGLLENSDLPAPPEGL